jgi:hypothetical protein
VALTTNYLKVALPGSQVPANQLVDVWVGHTSSGNLFGYARGAGIGCATVSDAE